MTLAQIIKYLFVSKREIQFTKQKPSKI